MGASSLRGALRRVGDAVPLTLRGLLVGGLCAAGLRVWGYGSLDLVAFSLGVSGLAVLGLALLLVLAAALWLRPAHRATPTKLAPRADADRPIESEFSLPALERVPLLALDWNVLDPPGMRCRTLVVEGRRREEIAATRRGEHSGLTRRITLGDAFGLVRIGWRREEPATLLVLPATRGLRRLSWLHALASGEGIPHPAGGPVGDRMEMRRYVPGDSVRHILWKKYARSRELEVRTPERSIHRARRTLAYLVAGNEDEAAAAAARVALESRALGEAWLFGADGSADATDRLPEALRAIARSAGSAAGRGATRDLTGGLRRFLGAAKVDGAAHCIVFAPVSLLASGRHLAEAVRGVGGAATLVFGLDGLRERAQERSRWERLLFADASPSGEPVGPLVAGLERLLAPGVGAIAVDRSSGRVVGARSDPGWRLSA